MPAKTGNRRPAVTCTIVLAFCICSASRLTPAICWPVPAPPHPTSAGAPLAPAPPTTSSTADIATGGTRQASPAGLPLPPAATSAHLVGAAADRRLPSGGARFHRAVRVGQLDIDRGAYRLHFRHMAAHQPQGTALSCGRPVGDDALGHRVQA